MGVGGRAVGSGQWAVGVGVGHWGYRAGARANRAVRG